MPDYEQCCTPYEAVILRTVDADPDCLVERVVNAALEEAMQEAETLLLNRLGSLSLADSSGQFNSLYSHCRSTPASH